LENFPQKLEMISVEDWEKRAFSLKAEIEKSLGNFPAMGNDIDDEDFLLLESLNANAGKYLLEDLSLSDLDDLDLELDGNIDFDGENQNEKQILAWPAEYSSICLKLTKLDALSSSPSSFWLEIGIPGLEPIRSRISKPKAKSIASKNNGITLDIVHSISLNIPVDSVLTFKLFAIGTPLGIPTRTAKSTPPSQDLWTGIGSIATKELFSSPE
jgi:hypothetical protein